MNHKGYLYTSALCLGRPHAFINLAANIKTSYVVLHFMLILCLLFVPVFALVVRTQPDQLYTRMFSQNFEGGAIKHRDTELFSREMIDEASPAIYAFADYVVYADSNIILPAPSEYFASGELSYPFGEVFGMIAVYNMYIPQFLLPMLMAAFVVLIILQLFFYFLSAVFFGIYRMASTRFGFGERLKIMVMGSLLPALLSFAIGFLLPAVHIILFQLLNLLMLFFLSKKYDIKERELFITEEAAENGGVT